MSVLIRGGRIVTAADDYVGDIYVEGERISLIGESLDVQADKVIDAVYLTADCGTSPMPAGFGQMSLLISFICHVWWPRGSAGPFLRTMLTHDFQWSRQ